MLSVARVLTMDKSRQLQRIREAKEKPNAVGLELEYQYKHVISCVCVLLFLLFSYWSSIES